MLLAPGALQAAGKGQLVGLHALVPHPSQHRSIALSGHHGPQNLLARRAHQIAFTPKRGSWLHVAAVELNVMIRQRLNRRIDSIETARAEVAAWQASRDRIQAKVNWQFTMDDARVKLKRFYPIFDE